MCRLRQPRGRNPASNSRPCGCGADGTGACESVRRTIILQLQSYNMKLESALNLLRDTIRLRHLALSTEESYCAWVARFSRFVKERCCGTESPGQKMELFLTQLARQDVAASTQNQAFCALLFFYKEVLKVEVGKVDALRAKKPAMLRFAPEAHEVMAVLGAAQDVGGYPTRTILRMLYGCGLRVSEPLNLRLRDVMLSEMKLVIRGAKGGKDRGVAWGLPRVQKRRRTIGGGNTGDQQHQVET